MILANGLPKNGKHLLFAWLEGRGLALAPGKLHRPTPRSRLVVKPGGDLRAPATPAEALAASPPRAFMHATVCAGTPLPAGTTQYLILRDPRDALTSAGRWWASGSEPGFAPAERPDDPREASVLLARNWWGWGVTVVEAYRLFEPWLRDPSVSVVRFREVAASGVPPTKTWTGRLSDWRKDLGEAALGEFRRLGGGALVADLEPWL